MPGRLHDCSSLNFLCLTLQTHIEVCHSSWTVQVSMAFMYNSWFTTRPVHLSRFSVSFARDFWFGHSCTDRDWNLRAFHGVRLHFVADSDDHVSILIPVFIHKRTVHLSTWTIQVSALFDVACWTAGRERIISCLALSHYSLSHSCVQCSKTVHPST